MKTPQERLEFLQGIRTQFEEFESWEEVDPEPSEAPEDELEDLTLTEADNAYLTAYTRIKRPQRPIGDV